MKLTIFIIAAFFIIALPFKKLEQCNLSQALQALPPRIFAETHADGSHQAPLITRFIHNKPGIFLSEFSRCYLYVLDPMIIYSSTGIFGTIAWGYLIYASAVSKNWPLLTLIFTFPLLLFFNIFQGITTYIHKLFAIIGLLFFLREK